MNLTALVSRFAAAGVTLLRALEPVQDASGVFVAPSAVETPLEPVTIHTLSGRDVAEMPEAKRNTETIQVYTTERLYAGDDGTHAPDRLRYRGRIFRVSKVFDEGENGGVWLAYAALEEPSS